MNPKYLVAVSLFLSIQSNAELKLYKAPVPTVGAGYNLQSAYDDGFRYTFGRRDEYFIYDSRSHQQVSKVKLPWTGWGAFQVDFVPNSKSVLLGGFRFFSIWNPETSSVIDPVIPKRAFEEFKFSHIDGAILAIEYQKATGDAFSNAVRVFDTEGMVERCAVTREVPWRIIDSALSPTEKTFALVWKMDGDTELFIEIRSLKTCETVTKARAVGTEQIKAKIDPTFSKLILAKNDATDGGTIAVHQLDSGALLSEFEAQMYHVEFTYDHQVSSDGRFFMATSVYNIGSFVWDLHKGKLVLSLPLGWRTLFAPDSSKIFSLAYKGGVSVWDLKSFLETDKHPEDLPDSLWHLKVRSDGKQFVVSGIDFAYFYDLVDSKQKISHSHTK